MSASYLDALNEWGAQRIEKDLHENVYRHKPTLPIKINRDSVTVQFVSEEGFACCGGSNPDCYCSQATSGTHEVEIRAADQNDNWVSVSIRPEDFHFATVLGEISEAGKYLAELAAVPDFE